MDRADAVLRLQQVRQLAEGIGAQRNTDQIVDLQEQRRHDAARRRRRQVLDRRQDRAQPHQAQRLQDQEQENRLMGRLAITPSM